MVENFKEGKQDTETWAQFESVFLEEFLPENELERNWEDWDFVRQRGRPLILKLEGINEFQKTRI